MKKIIVCISVVVIVFLICLFGYIRTTNHLTKEIRTVSFSDNQLYAVAYLGYDEMSDLSFYKENYSINGNIPIHYFSKGDYYLIIPRYLNMKMSLYKNDIDVSEPSLVFEQEESRPFVVQCNISDIFSDITVHLEYNNEVVEFSPFISLKDGSIVVGDRGVDITKTVGSY